MKQLNRDDIIEIISSKIELLNCEEVDAKGIHTAEVIANLTGKLIKHGVSCIKYAEMKGMELGKLSVFEPRV